MTEAEATRPEVEQYESATTLNEMTTIELVPFQGSKPYLGGFRNKHTDQIYHHADTQTLVHRSYVAATKAKKFHRDSQTTNVVTRSNQTTREHGTQMTRKDLDIRSTHTSLYARPYFDSDQHQLLKDSNVLRIQSIWRGYMGRCEAQRRLNAKHERAQALARQVEEDAAQAAAYQQREIQRRLRPRTKQDFEILYNELEQWRQFEASRIHNLEHDDDDHGHDDDRGTATKEAMMTKKKTKLHQMNQILEKETKLLQTIEKLKHTAASENRKQRIDKMLCDMARPKQWAMKNGHVRQVETPFTIRAKELKELYNGLTMNSLSLDERLDVLLHVKWTVKEFEVNLTREMTELIDREADMLHRGRKPRMMEGLRQRIANLFLQFIETPEFNPEASHFQH